MRCHVEFCPIDPASSGKAVVWPILGLDCSGLLGLSGLPRSGLLWLVLACYALSCGVLPYSELLWAVLACSGLFLVDLACSRGMTPTEFAAKSWALYPEGGKASCFCQRLILTPRKCMTPIDFAAKL